MMRKKWLSAIPLVLIAIQFFQPDRVNPSSPPEQHVSVAAAPPADVNRLFERACYDCHSNATRWPWYSRVAPFSWLVGDDVHRGRRELNFSEWSRYNREQKSHLLKEAREVVQEREMPPEIYLLAHREARLSDSEVARLAAWLEREREFILTNRNP